MFSCRSVATPASVPLFLFCLELQSLNNDTLRESNWQSPSNDTVFSANTNSDKEMRVCLFEMLCVAQTRGVHTLQNPSQRIPQLTAHHETTAEHLLYCTMVSGRQARGDQRGVCRNEIWLNVEVGKQLEQKLMNKMILLEATLLPVYV